MCVISWDFKRLKIVNKYQQPSRKAVCFINSGYSDLRKRRMSGVLFPAIEPGREQVSSGITVREQHQYTTKRLSERAFSNRSFLYWLMSWVFRMLIMNLRIF